MVLVGEVNEDKTVGGDLLFLGLAMLFVVWALR
jgi:hypothetical protein